MRHVRPITGSDQASDVTSPATELASPVSVSTSLDGRRLVHGALRHRSPPSVTGTERPRRRWFVG
jgi:hypothetical protein